MTGPGETTLVDVATPAVGPRDVLVKCAPAGSAVPICSTFPPAGCRPAKARCLLVMNPPARSSTSVAMSPASPSATTRHQQIFINLMSNELTIIGSMGYPTEIFEVTHDIIANWRNTP